MLHFDHGRQPNLDYQVVLATINTAEQIRIFRDNLGIIFVISPLCYGESPSNEYPQHMFLWRIDKNVPLIIIKYPHLFH